MANPKVIYPTTDFGSRLYSPIFDTWFRNLQVSKDARQPDLGIAYADCDSNTVAPFIDSCQNIVFTTNCGVFKIPYWSIDGCVRYATPQTAAAKKVVIRGDVATCGCDDILSITIRHTPPNYSYPIERIYVQKLSCECDYTLCQRSTYLQKQIQLDPDSPVTAAVDETTGEMTLTAKTAGQDFEVVANSGFFSADEVMPNVMDFGTSAQLVNIGALTGCVPSYECVSGKVFKVVMIPYHAWIPAANHGTFSQHTHSNNASVRVEKLAWIAFESTSCNTQFTALQNLLTDANPKLNKWAGIDTSIVPTYRWCMNRTDAGNPAAIADAVADYGANTTFWGRNSETGKSYYTIHTTSYTAPSAANVGDVFRHGECGNDDYQTNCGCNC